MAVRDGVEADLTALGMSDTGEGQAALLLAARLDAADGEQGGGMAAMARELRILMADLRARSIPPDDDPLERLKGKRDKRRG